MQTVLIVTEDPDVARRLTGVIAGWPCDVAIATDAGRARHLMDVLAFDAILVDAGEDGSAATAIASELRRGTSTRGRPRLVALVRDSAERMPRGFDAHVALAASEGEIVRVLLAGTARVADAAQAMSPGTSG